MTEDEQHIRDIAPCLAEKFDNRYGSKSLCRCGDHLEHALRREVAALRQQLQVAGGVLEKAKKLLLIQSSEDLQCDTREFWKPPCGLCFTCQVRALFPPIKESSNG